MSFPATVDAVVIEETGDFDVLQKKTIPFPEVTPQSIVVKTAYFGLNFADLFVRKGEFPNTLPHIMGYEATGTIVALPTDENVLNDLEYKAKEYKIGGKVTVIGQATHATYVSVGWKGVHPLPDGLDLRTAAGAISALTATTFLTEAYNVQKGDIVLIHSVAGSLGLFLTQYAKYRGATVIGTTSTPEKAALAKSYGADQVINYKTENTVDRVLEITKGQGVQAIFDGVGKDTFEDNFKTIARKGTIVSLGSASGHPEPFAPVQLSAKNVKFLRPTVFNYIVTAEERKHYFSELLELLDTNKLKVHIFKDYPFTSEGARQAQKDLAGGKSTGKLVIKVDLV
ncbi:NAD(P)-binding protein [Cylindrobasidium torrendii FP15055 ss-10]|uniref:Probable quinone oxidoreductase n=1 Tax=Cylindrobasidium torrendii FP15055 ss-10 TaxID=1314674 RepID=A0A0D7BS80_9AGAR|nr:NAD(P)-binding protein [Cylindrobasidium torrendii FP15055 ss-10]